MKDLESAKIGDLLYIPANIGTGSLEKVIRVTATQVIVGQKPREQKFRKSDGRKIGSSGWTRCWARFATVQDIDRVQKEKTIRRLTNFKWRELSDDKLAKIIEIIDKEPTQ